MLESIPTQQVASALPEERDPAAGPPEQDAPVEGAAVEAAEPGRDQGVPRSSRVITYVYIVTLLVLLTVAQARTPRLAVYVIFGVYVLVASVWVGSQYLEIKKGRLSVATGKVVAGLIAGGAASIVFGVVLDWQNVLWGWVIHPSTLIVLGVLAVYLGLGYAIARMRAQVAHRHDLAPAPSEPDLKTGAWLRAWLNIWGRKHRWALIGLVVMVGLFAAGALLLGDANIWGAAAVLGLPVVAFPWMLAVLSEYAVGDLDEVNREGQAGGKLLRLLGLSGAGLAFAGGVVAAIWGGSMLPFWVMLALALLICALTSSTLADIAVVLGVVALMGLTPEQDPKVEAPSSAADAKVLVALGDSYMSGEGAETFIEGTDEGDGNECRRATTAWAVSAGRGPVFDGVIFLACSGADTFNVRRLDEFAPPPEKQTGEDATQLVMYDQVSNKPADPALVVLSLGGNDAGFATIGLTCLVPGDCNDPAPSELWSAGNMDRVEKRLRQVYEQVDDTFGKTPVAIVPYPDPVADAAPCPSADLSKGDVKFISTFLTKLNKRIHEVADDYGFYYVGDMVTALKHDGLQLCDKANGGRPGLNFIGLRSVNGLADQRFNPTKWHHNSLHPNKLGHDALYGAFQRWLDSQGGLEQLANRTDTANPGREKPVTETYSRDGSDCANFEVDGDQGCKALSTNWAFDQTGKFVLMRGIVAVAVIAGAWLASVAFFASRRRLRPDVPATTGGR